MLHIQITPGGLFVIGGFCLILLLIEAGGLAAVGIMVFAWFFAVKTALEERSNQRESAQKATDAGQNAE